MSEEDYESLLNLQNICQATNSLTDPAPAPQPEVAVPDSPASIYDLNDVFLLALTLQNQLKFNEKEYLE